nr:MAG: hypothetical protein DIU54_08740 [Acidobacteriota bacterium]
MGGRGAGGTLPRGTAVPRTAWFSRVRAGAGVATPPALPARLPDVERERAGAGDVLGVGAGRGSDLGVARGTATEPPPEPPSLPDDEPLDLPPRGCACAPTVTGSARLAATKAAVRNVVSLRM